MRTRLTAVTAVATLLLLVSGVGACSSGGSPAPAPAPPSTGSTPAPGPVPAPVPSPARLVPLWPFTTLQQVATWQAGYRATGAAAWHLDVERTALAFSRDHLGYREVDRVTTRSVDRGDAELGVGWTDDEGGPHTVGVLHLVRFGAGQDAPWVVVGSEDTVLTLTTPRYGATVTSPLVVGGEITGVDESLHVKVLGPVSATPLVEVTGLPAGGERTPWTTTLRFTAPSGTVLTVAVSTGGHVRSVERFAVTAVRAA